MSIIERTRLIDEQTAASYLPDASLSSLPVLVKSQKDGGQQDFQFERELIFKYLLEMKNEVAELKKMVHQMSEDVPLSIHPNYSIEVQPTDASHTIISPAHSLSYDAHKDMEPFAEPEVVDDNCSLVATEKELVKKALAKHNNNRRQAAKELGISERTLYRKINDFGL